MKDDEGIYFSSRNVNNILADFLHILILYLAMEKNDVYFDSLFVPTDDLKKKQYMFQSEYSYFIKCI